MSDTGRGAAARAPQPDTFIAMAFLMQVSELQPEGWMAIAVRNPSSGAWIERSFRNRGSLQELAEFLDGHPAQRYDHYFAPSAFREPCRRAEHVLPSCFAHADIDDANPFGYQPAASALWLTSPGRWQGLWRFLDRRAPEKAEAVSRYLVNTFGGDRGGHSCTKLLRIPGTINHKAIYDSPIVTLIEADFTPIAAWPDMPIMPTQQRASMKLDPFAHDAGAVLREYLPKVEPRYRGLLRDKKVNSPDRSRCVFMMVAALHKAGASLNEIASVLWASPYFQSRCGHLSDARDMLSRDINRIINKLESDQ